MRSRRYETPETVGLAHSEPGLAQSGQERFLEEMEQHLIRLTEENVRLGMSPEEARRQAVLKFGAAGAIREQYHAEKSLPLIESAAQDVRYAARILRRSWGLRQSRRHHWRWPSAQTRRSSR